MVTGLYFGGSRVNAKRGAVGPPPAPFGAPMSAGYWSSSPCPQGGGQLQTQPLALSKVKVAPPGVRAK